jgi:hypothetical protein
MRQRPNPNRAKPRGVVLITERDRRIFERFNAGETGIVLAAELGIRASNIWRIVRNVRTAIEFEKLGRMKSA